MRLSALYREYERMAEPDSQCAVAQVLRYLGAATPAQDELCERYRAVGPLRRTTVVTRDAWSRLLFDMADDSPVGEILSVVVPAVLDERFIVPRGSRPAISAGSEAGEDLRVARSFARASSILRIEPIALHLSPEWGGLVEVVPHLPRGSRLGRLALSGRSERELAFLAARHVAYFREEFFIALLVPDWRWLADVFQAALAVGNPGHPLSGSFTVPRVVESLKAILGQRSIDLLRQLSLRAAEANDRVDVSRWALSVERKCAQAGLLLSGDLKAAEAVFALEVGDRARLDEKMNDLLSFTLSERASRLRKALGISLA